MQLTSSSSAGWARPVLTTVGCCVSRPCLQAEDVMTKAAGGCVLRLHESYETLVNALDANKMTAAFPVVTDGSSGGEQGDFKGIISRARQARQQGCLQELCVLGPACCGSVATGGGRPLLRDQRC